MSFLEKAQGLESQLPEWHRGGRPDPLFLVAGHNRMTLKNKCWPEILAVVETVDALMDADMLNNGAAIADLSTALEALDKKAEE